MALSNIGLLPGRSDTYAFLRSTGVSIAIVLILLSIDIHWIVRAGPRMLAAFAIGAAGTAIGATVAGLALHRLVGPETWKLSGQCTGTYIGGGVNFASLARAFNTGTDLFSAAIAADVAVTNIWLLACLILPVLLRRGAKFSATGADTEKNMVSESPASPTGPTSKDSESSQVTLVSSVRPVSLVDVSALVMIAVGLIWCSGRLATLILFTKS